MAEKVSKESVDYGPAKSTSRERCGNCEHFLPRERACEVVRGAISRGDWCSRWEAR